ncbi:unnamed protein product [Thelazia callipaeda]|uniref:Arginine/serine-rich protein PNISR n=1 Tax=Thelazia callipaeda TaxID=103827 RepID=A0A0N5CUX2_THECL|nr:unnamed protein product [Thelazia callipaeda]
MAENAKWLDASYYQNIPNSEVNWAQLAQKWIQMRDAGELPSTTSGDSIPPPPAEDPPPLPHVPQAPDGLSVNGSFLPPGGYLPTLPVEPNFVNGPSPCWIPPIPPNNFGPPPPPPPPPPGAAFPPFMPPVPPWMGVAPIPPGSFPPPVPYGHAKHRIDDEEGDEASFLILFIRIFRIYYSHYFNEWDEKQKVTRRDDSEDAETVPEGAMAHWLKPGPGWIPQNWYHPSRRESPSNSHNMPFIDQQTRKALPAWILEGLEKAELERQKKYIKEAKLQAAEEAARARRAAKGLGKFDSDSSEEGNENETTRGATENLDGEPVFLQKIKQQQEQSTDDESGIDYRSEEERREDALMLLRRFMTEILLETTDDELNRIAKEQFELAKRSGTLFQ